MTGVFDFLGVDTWVEFWWIVLGFVAQFLFAGRFIVQWIASERARRSIVPLTFWYFSVGGGVLLLAYAIHRADPVFIMGQSLGLVVYSRNLWLIRAEARARRQPEAAPASDAP